MNRHRVLVVTVIAALLLAVTGLTYAQEPGPETDVSTQAALGTTFTYQGQLTDGGSPAGGAYDFRFTLYEAATGGSQVGSTVTKGDVDVSEGLFTVRLDFGDVFDGTALWMSVRVRPGSSTGPYTALSPRQKLTAAPYALALPGLRTEQNALSPNLIGGYSGNSVSADVHGATIGGGGESGKTNSVTYQYGTVSGGNGNTAGGNAATVGGGSYNTASGHLATVGGGVGNKASDLWATVGGGYRNTASGQEATVGGGYRNTASGQEATVGGGDNNTASGDYATVGGGDENTSGYRATIGGGHGNTASGSRATIGGGSDNQATEQNATVGGGHVNVAGSWYSTVPGGLDNEAAGYASFAAGVQAKALHDGSFVWADPIEPPFASTSANQFNVRATNGVRFETDNDSYGLRVNNPHLGGDGVYVDNAGGDGVYVRHAEDDGMSVVSADNRGIAVNSAGGDGVYVCSTGDRSGCSPDGGNHGLEVGNAQHDGVHVISAQEHGVYVGSATLSGVWVESADGAGVYAHTNATYGFYTPEKIYAGDGYDDIAEHINVTGEVGPGDVVVIDPDHDQRVVRSTSPYDPAVAGIISTDPAMVIGKSDTETPLALAGRVVCKVSAENGSIQRGDLLTTSSTPGHAMKATEPTLGTILGKAMGELESGTGTITVLVTLQ